MMPGFTFLPPANFLGLPPEDSSLETSHAVLLPVPYEATTSYKGGTREGPQAILDASTQVELYDREFGEEPARRWGIHTLPFLAPDFRGPEAMVETIASAAAHYGESGKLLGLLGGEHTVSVGALRGLARSGCDFITVQLDAHADLRSDYDGTPFSHACTARRILEYSPLVQLGIRSLDTSEAEFLRAQGDHITTFYADEMQQDRQYLAALASAVQYRSIYLTVDLDVLDPSIMPAVGTPEPGGLSWYMLLEIIRTIARHGQIIAFDCVELSPIPGQHAPNFTAAKLVYKIISLALASPKTAASAATLY